MISLREITEENFDAIIRMSRPKDEGFVASNSYSLAQCWLYRENHDCFPYAVYYDEAPVGFLLLEEDPEERELCIWRIMFPEENTCKGYGTETVRLVLEMAKEKAERYDLLTLDCDPENVRARHVYEKLGFRETGRINHGSIEMAIRID